MLVVLTQFDNTHSQNTVLLLGEEGTASFVIPADNYAGHYTEFAVTSGDLYQQQSREDGYRILRYPLN